MVINRIWLRRVVAKALIKEPELRYQTAAEMRAALTPQPQPAKEILAPPPPRQTVTVDESPPKREPIVIKPQPAKPEPIVDAGQSFTENLNGVKLEMVGVPGGSFLMGSPVSEEGRYDDEGPQHFVTVQAFSIGKYEITQAQWKAMMGSNNRLV